MDLVERLKEHATGYEEWRVANPADGSYVISFSWSESSNPEREAREWLADHLSRNPGSWVEGYEVRKVMVHGERDEMMREAADEITRLRTRLEIIPGTEIDGIGCRDETIRLQDAETGRLRARLDTSGHELALAQAEAMIERQSAEIRRLQERCTPSKVVMIGDTGHYVSEVVAYEIERLQKHVKTDADAYWDARESLVERIEDLRADAAECDALRTKLADILTRTANALKGEPAPLTLHSWHDLPEWAQRLRKDAERLDWMSSREAWIGWTRDNELCRAFRRDEDGDVYPECGWDKFFGTARDAIDAAMQKGE